MLPVFFINTRAFIYGSWNCVLSIFLYYTNNSSLKGLKKIEWSRYWQILSRLESQKISCSWRMTLQTFSVGGPEKNVNEQVLAMFQGARFSLSFKWDGKSEIPVLDSHTIIWCITARSLEICVDSVTSAIVVNERNKDWNGEYFAEKEVLSCKTGRTTTMNYEMYKRISTHKFREKNALTPWWRL